MNALTFDLHNGAALEVTATSMSNDLAIDFVVISTLYASQPSWDLTTGYAYLGDKLTPAEAVTQTVLHAFPDATLVEVALAGTRPYDEESWVETCIEVEHTLYSSGPAGDDNNWILTGEGS